MSKLKIILDTNVLVSAFTSQTGASRAILRRVLQGQYQTLISLPLFLEYEDVLSRKETLERCPLNGAEMKQLLEAVLSKMEWVEVYYQWRPNLKDEADNHLIELAVAAGDVILLTHNLKDLKSGELLFNEIKILTPAQFLQQHH
jgi:putative PIN family toxin of toxin-antitoxin system